MACVFGEMRALKTSERAAAVSPKSVPFRKVSRNSIEGEMRRQCWRPLLVSACLINCVAFDPSPVTSLVHLARPTAAILVARDCERTKRETG